MPWVRFTDNYDFSPADRNGLVTIAYKKGMSRNVTTECATRAIAAGKATKANSPKKTKTEDEKGAADES